ncbi:MAG: EI24 domain-containing protein [Sulfitobacter sp.]
MGLGLILRCFGLAISQLSDSRFRRVFLIGVGLSLALLIGAVAGFSWLIDAITPEQVWLPILGEVTWVHELVSWGGVFLLMFLSIFLMVPVASAITSMFLDDVADAVEAVHYPLLPQNDGVPFTEALRDTINFLGILLGANLIALLLALIFAPVAPLIFWGVNGFLLGREYFTMAAMRRVGRKNAKALRRKHIGTIWVAGVLMAMPLSVPLINLLVPILGAATFTHLFHQLASREGSASSRYHQP